MLLHKNKAHHERFGELAALAAIGEVSPEEFRELQTHLQTCSSCRDEYADYSDLLGKHLPLTHDNILSAEFSSVETSEKAKEEASVSIPRKALLPLVAKLWHGIPIYALMFALVWLLTTGGFLLKFRDSEQKHSMEISQLTEEISKLRSSSAGPVIANSPSTSKSETEPDTASLQQQYFQAMQQDQLLQQQLAIALAQAHDLQNQVVSGQKKEDALSSQLSETVTNLNSAQAALAQIKNEMDAAQGNRSQDGATIAQQRDHLRDMQDQLVISQSMIDQDKKLLAADRDIRDLMGARNLRIVDVFDIDGKGKTGKPFGRVFFTEGKSLIFYAFDLQDARPGVQSASFQAWGFEDPRRNEARSLGIFYKDDKNANRWVLKFDDSNILTGIDSVFVTMEPSGGSKKPTGTKLLAAYLKADLNHP